MIVKILRFPYQLVGNFLIVLSLEMQWNYIQKNLTLKTISFIMRINKPMKYIELETTSGFKRKFLIDNKKSKTKIFAAGTWSDQKYTISIDNFFNWGM